MTTPKVKTLKRGGQRFYVDPVTKRKNPGVTSVLNMLPKPFLMYWAQKVVAEQAVENLGSVVGLALSDPQGAIDYLKRSPQRTTRQAADTGSGAHDLFEQIAKGEPLRRVPAELRPFVDHFREFMEVCEPEFEFLEETVWSDTHGYAGSFDAFGVLTGEGAGELRGLRLFFDWKTTRSGVYEEVALQLTGYRRGESLIRADGSRVPMPKSDGAAVLHVRPEGWALYPIVTDPFEIEGQEVDPFDYFLALREVFDWDTEIKKHVIGRPLVGGGEFAVAPKTTKINKPKTTRARKKKKEADE